MFCGLGVSSGLLSRCSVVSMLFVSSSEVVSEVCTEWVVLLFESVVWILIVSCVAFWVVLRLLNLCF